MFLENKKPKNINFWVFLGFLKAASTALALGSLGQSLARVKISGRSTP